MGAAHISAYKKDIVFFLKNLNVLFKYAQNILHSEAFLSRKQR